MLNEETYYYENYGDEGESEDSNHFMEFLQLHRYVYQLIDQALVEKAQVQMLPPKQMHQISELPEATMRHIYHENFPEADFFFYKDLYALLNIISELPVQRGSYQNISRSEKYESVRKLRKRFLNVMSEEEVLPMAQVMQALIHEGLNPFIMNHIYMMKMVARKLAEEQKSYEVVKNR